MAGFCRDSHKLSLARIFSVHSVSHIATRTWQYHTYLISSTSLLFLYIFMHPFSSFYRTNAQPFRIRERAEAYFYQGVFPATRKAYRTGLQKFNFFCTQVRRKAIPTSEITLLLFATYLAGQSLSLSTIQVYLSAVHNAHVAKGQYNHSRVN